MRPAERRLIAGLCRPIILTAPRWTNSHAFDQHQDVTVARSVVFEFIDAFADQKHAQSAHRLGFQRHRGVDVRRFQRIVRARIILYFDPKIGLGESEPDLDGPSLTRSIAVRNDVGQVFLQGDV